MSISLALVFLAVPQITFETSVREAADLARLARLVEPTYHTIQFSSYDRRSVSPESAGWFSNADGFGREPIPGFLDVLQEPDERGVGRYIVARVDGPGMIVRGWSAGMGGTLRVYLDGHSQALFEGPADVFLRDRASHFLSRFGLDVGIAEVFEQVDADYLPIPFSRSLEITWEGRLEELHFYHIQARVYASETEVQTFEPERDLVEALDTWRETADRMRVPRPALKKTAEHVSATRLLPRESAVLRPEVKGPGAISELVVRVESEDLELALRGIRFRMAFDGCQRPQIEAPIGDFFGTGPGVNPFVSLPFTVESNGTMRCRWVMPYEHDVLIELHQAADVEATIHLEIAFSAWEWDERSLHFRARWRADHDIVTASRENALDLPFLLLRGEGTLVGAAAMITNPSPIPTPGGNWWGEGDEKIFVDDEPFPSTFGTGSEDYFNYSWSRPDLFSHPYCGQPLDSGPGTSGYISNHRFHILDDIRFERFLGFFMELWQHEPVPGLSYARLCWAYARPGAVDDHRALGGADLRVIPLPPREPAARGQATGSRIVVAESANPTASRGDSGLRTERLAPRGQAFSWSGSKGDSLDFTIPIEKDGSHAINFVAKHSPSGAVIRLSADGTPVSTRGQGEKTSLRTNHATRFLNVFANETRLSAGDCTLHLEVVEAGEISVDYFWIRRVGPSFVLDGAIEAEVLAIVESTAALGYESQRMDAGRWSSDSHLWVRATEIGQRVILEVPVVQPGRHRISVRLTKSWDYGILAISLDGERVIETVDTFNGEGRTCDVTTVDLGQHEIGESCQIAFEVVGKSPESESPGTYFGIDCIVIE